MTEDELHAQAYVYAVGALSGDELREFEAHLAGCAVCRREVDEMEDVTAHLSEIVAAEPPAGLRSAVLAQAAETAQDPRPGAAAHEHAGAAPPRGRHAAAVSEPEQTAAGEVTAPPSGRRWRERAPVMVAAAVVLAAVGLSGWALSERNDARDDVAASQQLMDKLTSALSARDVQSASMSTKSGALTTVVRSQARGVALLLATDLPALPAGKTYQAWTIDSGTPRSAGTFESQGHQTAFELPDAALRTRTVAVSVEPAGGSDQPTTDPIVALDLS
jgi:anti-sigma-K factor RskA